MYQSNHWIINGCDVSYCRYTYLDSQYNGGRPVLILKARNLVEEHDMQVTVSYNFAKSRMVVEPMILVASFFVFFVVCSILARLGDASVPATGVAKKEKST